jgi:CHRD domain-containing protein
METTTSALNPTHGTLDRPQLRGEPHIQAVHRDESDYHQSFRSAWRRDGGRACLVIVMAATILLLQSEADAQRREVFEARLTAVPVDTVTVRTTTGSGSVTAVLEGNTLTLAGKFDGMNSPATAAHVHRARKGLRGPNVFDLTVTKATSGTIEGTLRLTPTQVEELAKGGYYVQIHTEKNSDGHLRGWLLK